MTLPIIAYGQDVLRQRCKDISTDYLGLSTLIADMWETLYVAHGCGLAASQVNHPIRLFIIDSLQTYEHMNVRDRLKYFEGDTGIKETFINAEIIDRSTSCWKEEEGCLSIPGLAEEVERAWSITIRYIDKDFNTQTKTFSASTARMIQHEYDHTEGILYLDYLKPFTRNLLKGKLKKIADGKIKVKYPMAFK